MLAIDAGIHGAIVGGLIGGAVVLLGIGLTEWLRRIGDRRRQLENAVHDLNIWLPIWLVYLGPDPPDPKRDKMGTPGWEANQRVVDALFRADVSVRRGPLRKRRKIKRELDSLAAKTAAVFMRARKGQYLTYSEMPEITTAEVRSLVSGNRDFLDDEIERYVRDGFLPAESH
jgi:hypothetical protein